MYTLYTQASQANINGVLNVKRMSCTTPQSTTPDAQNTLMVASHPVL